MWPPSTRPTLGYTLPSEMGMFVVAPTFHASTGNNNTNQNPNQPDHHHHHHHHHSLVSDPHAHLNPSSTALGVGVGVGVIPLLTATPCLGAGVGGFESDDLMNRSRTHGGGGGGGGGGIQLWHTTQQHNQLGSYNNNTSTSKKSTINFEQHGAAPTTISCLPTSSGGSGTATCQDCGNQAKKDCSHRRCRTCCRSRGFDCSTHVKSTWVPAARRRERQMIGGPVGTTGGCGGGGGGGASSGSTSGVKKPRLISSQNTATTSHTSTSNTPPRSFDTSSSYQDASFKESLPGQVKAPAVFKCVRVTAVEDGDDEYAYQAVVKIGGHVFKGFLYDQGIESREGFPNLSELHLGGGGGRSNGVSSSSPLIDPTDVYGSSGGAGGLLGGSNYGNTVT